MGLPADKSDQATGNSSGFDRRHNRGASNGRDRTDNSDGAGRGDIPGTRKTVQGIHRNILRSNHRGDVLQWCNQRLRVMLPNPIKL